jgi:5-methyltetrahydrofolate--homocysteine methyltransferase
MGILLDRLAKKKLLLSDGAWGTMMQAQGLMGGDIPELWNAIKPEAVRSIARAYGDVGCDLVLTNTFGGSRSKLEKAGLGERVAELNEKGARLSLEGAPDAVIAASVGPTGEFLEPVGDMTAEQMEAIFFEQFQAIFKGGVKALCIETQSSLDEAACAVLAAKKLDRSVDVICTMTFNATPGGYKTMMGVSIEQAAKGLTEAGADIVGANCGNGMAQMLTIAAEFKKHTDTPILIHANAGMPQLVDGKTTFKETPADMGRQTKQLVAAGASIIGGCCGTTPQHIAAIKAALDPLRR